jgi:hypothetical protein
MRLVFIGSFIGREGGLVRNAIILSILFAVCVCALNYSGFCWGRLRWLSDKEKMDAAVSYVINDGRIFGEYYFDVNKIRRKRDVQAIKYESVSDFYKLNPDCCRFVDASSDGFSISLIEKLSVGPVCMAHLRFKIRYKKSSASGETFYEDAYPLVNGCGYASFDF